MTSYPPPGQYPPPPPAVAAASVQAPPVAWLVPVAALLAVIGAVLPWFRPEAIGHGRTIDATDALHSWEDGKVGLLPAIALLIVAAGMVSLLLGKGVRRFSSGSDPVRSAAKYTVGVGLVSGLCLAIAWFLVTTQYKTGTSSWSALQSQLKAAGYDLSRGPQPGYYLTIGAAALATVAGVLVLVMAKPTAAPPPPAGYEPQPISLEKPAPPH